MTGVFIRQRFRERDQIRVVAWEHVKPAILGAIMENYLSGAPSDGGERTPPPAAHPDHSGEDPRSSARSRRCSTPACGRRAQDGGDITFQAFDRGVVHLQACKAPAPVPVLDPDAEDGTRTCSGTTFPKCSRCALSTSEPLNFGFDTCRALARAALLSGDRVLAQAHEPMAKGPGRAADAAAAEV